MEFEKNPQTTKIMKTSLACERLILLRHVTKLNFDQVRPKSAFSATESEKNLVRFDIHQFSYDAILASMNNGAGQTAYMCGLNCAFQRLFALDLNMFLMTGLNFNHYVRSGNSKIFDINVSQP